MEVLRDVSNQHEGEQPTKRQRLSSSSLEELDRLVRQAVWSAA